jgi:hypothetical protein
VRTATRAVCTCYRRQGDEAVDVSNLKRSGTFVTTSPAGATLLCCLGDKGSQTQQRLCTQIDDFFLAGNDIYG